MSHPKGPSWLSFYSGERSLSAMTTDLAPTAAPIQARRTRTVTTWILVILFGVVTPLTIVSGWAVKTVTDTNRFVSTLQPLANDPIVTTYLANQATQKLFVAFHVEAKVTKQLPPSVRFLAPPLTAQLQSYTEKAVQIFFRSKTFQTFWNYENRYLQINVINTLEGKTPPLIAKTRTMAMNLTPMVIGAIDELDARGITVFNPIRSELQHSKRILTLQLISPKQLQTARTIFSLAILGRTVLFILTPLVALSAILITWRRRVTALRLALSGLGGSIVVTVLLKIIRTFFITSAPGAQGPLAAAHVFDALFRYMSNTTTWSIVSFAMVAALFWLAGPSTWALGIRKIFSTPRTQGERNASQAMESAMLQRAEASFHKVLVWKTTHIRLLAGAGVAVAAVALLMVQGTGAILGILIALAAYEIVLGLFSVAQRDASEHASLDVLAEHQES